LVRSYKIGQGISQILVINRIRVLGSGPHTSREYPPGGREGGKCSVLTALVTSQIKAITVHLRDPRRRTTHLPKVDLKYTLHLK